MLILRTTARLLHNCMHFIERLYFSEGLQEVIFIWEWAPGILISSVFTRALLKRHLTQKQVHNSAPKHDLLLEMWFCSSCSQIKLSEYHWQSWVWSGEEEKRWKRYSESFQGEHMKPFEADKYSFIRGPRVSYFILKNGREPRGENTLSTSVQTTGKSSQNTKKKATLSFTIQGLWCFSFLLPISIPPMG